MNRLSEAKTHGDSLNGDLVANVTAAGVGLALVFWARTLSVRYNAWTTALRERHRNINPPPTPEGRAGNTKSMTGLLRVTGVFLFLVSIMRLLTLIGTPPH